MWADEALPRLRDRGLGLVGATRTLRLAGIGESQVAAELGEAILRAADPVVATYARSDAVDVRISARGPRRRRVVSRRRGSRRWPSGWPRRWPGMSGPKARRPGRTRSATRWPRAMARSRSSRSGPPGASPRCSATGTG